MQIQRVHQLSIIVSIDDILLQDNFGFLTSVRKADPTINNMDDAISALVEDFSLNGFNKFSDVIDGSYLKIDSVDTTTAYYEVDYS